MRDRTRWLAMLTGMVVCLGVCPTAADARPGDRPTFPTPHFMPLKLGTHADADALRAALARSPCHVGHLAETILRSPVFRTQPAEIEVTLAILSADDLGVEEEGATLLEVHERAKRLGYALAPAEVGPQLCLQYSQQPVGEFLSIAMPPVATDASFSSTFAVGNGGAGPVLVGIDWEPGLDVTRAMRLVFVRPFRLVAPATRTCPAGDCTE